jgi:hypothetical protein
MKIDIEKQFLKAFEKGGVLWSCVEVMLVRWDLWLELIDTVAIEWGWDVNKQLSPLISEGYCFHKVVLYEELYDEINGNLYECKTKQDKERYLCELITPFYLLSNVLYPAYPECTEKTKEDCKRLYIISKRFQDAQRSCISIPGVDDDVVKIYSELVEDADMFADRLDALCLKHNIDFFKLQKDCGVYLKKRRNMNRVEKYIGTPKLVQKYINELPEATEEQPDLPGDSDMWTEIMWDTMELLHPEAVANESKDLTADQGDLVAEEIDEEDTMTWWTESHMNWRVLDGGMSLQERNKELLAFEAYSGINNSVSSQEQLFPPELNTDEAKMYFDRAIEAGFMNADYSFKGTKYQKALFAEVASEVLKIKRKWRAFEILWNTKHLAQTRRESREQIGKVDREKEISALFNRTIKRE